MIVVIKIIEIIIRFFVVYFNLGIMIVVVFIEFDCTKIRISSIGIGFTIAPVVGYY